MLQRYLTVPQALSGGLLAFGLPMEGPRPHVSSTVLYRHGDIAWAETPIARVLLTIGDFVTQEQFDELSKRIAGSADAGSAGGAAVTLAAEPQ